MNIRIHPNMLPSLLGSILFATSEEPWSPIRKASASPERLDARSECSVIDGWWWMYIDVINECWYNVDRCWWVLWANISHWCPLSFVWCVVPVTVVFGSLNLPWLLCFFLSFLLLPSRRLTVGGVHSWVGGPRFFFHWTKAVLVAVFAVTSRQELGLMVREGCDWEDVC